MKNITIVVVVAIAAGALLWVVRSYAPTPASAESAEVYHPAEWLPVDPAKTRAYMESLDLEAMQRRGCDFDDAYYDPTRYGYTMDELRDMMARGENRAYDAERFERAARKLDGVDRRAALEHIFETVTAEAGTNTEKHLALLKFMHRVTYHSTYIRPRFPDEQDTRCFDPLILLELNEMHCGQVSRLAQDLWEAGGYEARGLQFGGKASAEVFYDGAWHYFDGDSVGGNGMAVLKDDGTVPSWYEMSEQPHLIDLLPYRYELTLSGAPRQNSPRYRSVNCFYDTRGDDRLYWDKARPAEPGEPNYGWQVEKTRQPADWIMYEDEPRTMPGAPCFKSVTVTDGPGPGRRTVEIAWRASRDDDGDLLGYRVYVGSKPRGWNYARFPGGKTARAYWSNDGGWEPEMYDALHTLPPRDVDLVKTAEPRVTLDLAADQEVFVTVVPFDAYGESIGREFYLMSNELRIGPARGSG